MKETVNNYGAMRLEEARKIHEFTTILKKETTFCTEQNGHSYTDIYKEQHIETANARSRPFFFLFDSAQKTVNKRIKVAELDLNMNELHVKDRDSYAVLKKVAEQCPWMDAIQKDWDFDPVIDVDIQTPQTQRPKERTKPLKVIESTEMKTRYESIEGNSKER